MAQGGMKPFTIVLGGIAVIGVGLIAWQMTGGPPPRPSLSSAPVAPAAGPRGVVVGSDSAPVEIAEFADFECPWCARFAILTMQDIKNRLVATGRARLRFVHFPLDMHPNSPTAHLAAACGNEQGRFWQMHDGIYDVQADLVASRRPDRTMREVARRVGLDLGRYDSCMREQRAWPQVMADKNFGLEAGVNGTPSFLINGRMLADGQVPRTGDEWVRLVDSLAAAAAAVTPPAARRPRG